MAEGAGLGLTLTTADIATLYGEDQARYLVALPASRAETLLAQAAALGIPAATVGQFGGDTVKMGGESAPLAALSALYRGAFAQAVA